MTWTVVYLGQNDGDTLLEVGEKAQITVEVANAITATSGTALGTDTQFALEFKPPAGAAMVLQRRMPAGLDTVMNLN